MIPLKLKQPWNPVLFLTIMWLKDALMGCSLFPTSCRWATHIYHLWNRGRKTRGSSARGKKYTVKWEKLRAVKKKEGTKQKKWRRRGRGKGQHREGKRERGRKRCKWALRRPRSVAVCLWFPFIVKMDEIPAGPRADRRISSSTTFFWIGGHYSKQSLFLVAIMHAHLISMSAWPPCIAWWNGPIYLFHLPCIKARWAHTSRHCTTRTHTVWRGGGRVKSSVCEIILRHTHTHTAAVYF